MKKLTVSASKTYDILIGENLLSKAGHYIKTVSAAAKVCVVTDSTVDALYSKTVVDSLIQDGFDVVKFVFNQGEKQKSHSTLLELYEFLCYNGITRTDLLVALGGGVTGDLTGFAAATYLRGVDFVQIPTTLLAQVDSSVGGKTGVNIDGGKNLVGAFNQPLLVICDTNVLDTLSEDIFADGMGEVIKYGMIRSASLFEMLKTGGIRENKALLKEVIYQCVSIKRDVVQNDELDTGERMILNFGHTLGHAIEKHYNFSGISHGKAVAVGMCMISELAEKKEMIDKGVSQQLMACLLANKLPVSVQIPIESLYKFCLNDKKRTSSNIRFILCPQIGVSKIFTMTIDEFVSFILD